MLADTPFVDDECNPIDSLESVLNAYNWVFDRMNDEELFVKLTGKETEYNVYFIWDETAQLLQICCQYDVQISADNLDAARAAILQLNDSLLLGHFSLPSADAKPSFRYSTLIKSLSDEHVRALVNDMVDLSLAQCERYSPTFTILSAAHAPQEADLALAMMETQGRS